MCMCVSVRTGMKGRNDVLFAEKCRLFDSCVKSWEYFRTDNILLETSFYWLSDDVARFKIEVGVEEKCTKM